MSKDFLVPPSPRTDHSSRHLGCLCSRSRTVLSTVSRGDRGFLEGHNARTLWHRRARKLIHVCPMTCRIPVAYASEDRQTGREGLGGQEWNSDARVRIIPKPPKKIKQEQLNRCSQTSLLSHSNSLLLYHICGIYSTQFGQALAGH